VSEISWFILTFIPLLVLIPGAWALAVWAARQPDSQSKMVEKLTTRGKDFPEEGRSKLRARRADEEKSPAGLCGAEVNAGTARYRVASRQACDSGYRPSSPVRATA
jgi:hypothetical protein